LLLHQNVGAVTPCTRGRVLDSITAQPEEEWRTSWRQLIAPPEHKRCSRFGEDDLCFDRISKRRHSNKHWKGCAVCNLQAVTYLVDNFIKSAFPVYQNFSVRTFLTTCFCPFSEIIRWIQISIIHTDFVFLGKELSYLKTDWLLEDSKKKSTQIFNTSTETSILFFLHNCTPKVSGIFSQVMYRFARVYLSAFMACDVPATAALVTMTTRSCLASFASKKPHAGVTASLISERNTIKFLSYCTCSLGWFLTGKRRSVTAL
jgi:hypothetical protein